MNYTRKVKKNDLEFTILIKNGIGIANFISSYEIWFDQLLVKLIEKEDAVFLDIGANVGQTMLKVLPAYPKVRYLGVEPNEYCAHYLQELCKVNQFTNVQLFNCALSNTEGEAELLLRYQDDLLATTSHSFRKFTRYSTKKSVPKTTGDSLIQREGINQISVIKIDVEGGEADIIEGLLNTIAFFKPHIICEILPLNTEDEGSTTYRKHAANKMIAILHEQQYIIQNIISGTKVNTIEDLSTSLESSNYVFVHEDKLSVLL